jgi:two-component system, chemotaxis family, response regulator Rcp1
VLVVEDNETDVLVIGEVLKDCGTAMEVRVVRDGESALECLAEFAPGLILLDLNLPRLPGLHVLAEVRRREHLADVPVVIVTSSDSNRDVETARELNVSAYFCKPGNLVEFMNLAGIIRRVLNPRPDAIS